MDVVKKVSALRARKRLGQLLEEVYYKGDQYLIERAGRPMAAVVPVWQLEERERRRDRLFSMVEGVWRRGKNLKPEVAAREVKTAVQAVREGGKRRRA
jgi:prevent-host-death family protein